MEIESNRHGGKAVEREESVEGVCQGKSSLVDSGCVGGCGRMGWGEWVRGRTGVNR